MSMMELQPRHTLLASHFCHLDSDVLLGGGTDETEILQSLLDNAEKWGELTLILDGAALVRGLRVYSHTTILCPNKACGLFLKADSNCALLENAHMDFMTIHDVDITLLGGTYNHNSPEQKHDTPCVPDPSRGALGTTKWCIGFEFYGVAGLTIKNITMRNQRTFTMLVANWRDVVMEDIYIDLPDNQYAQNQDGIHFWGPGRFLSMRNIRGTSGDDFIALAPDENDYVSSIEDVTIDGVHLENADQGIRMLSRGTGRLDRVVVRNVTGTYKSFGFFIDPFFPDSKGGNYGHITIENVDLRPTEHRYTFRDPMLFLIGGRIERLELRHIHAQGYEAKRLPIEFGDPFYSPTDDPNAVCLIRDAQIEDFTVFGGACEIPLRVQCRVDHLRIRDLRLLDGPKREAAVVVGEHGVLKRLQVFDSEADGCAALVKNMGKIDEFQQSGSLIDGEPICGNAPGKMC